MRINITINKKASPAPYGYVMRCGRRVIDQLDRLESPELAIRRALDVAANYLIKYGDGIGTINVKGECIEVIEYEN